MTTPGEIQVAVAEEWAVKIDDLRSSRKSRDLSDPRAAYYWLCKELTTVTLEVIGFALGGKKSSSVCKGVAVAKCRREVDDDFFDRTSKIFNAFSPDMEIPQRRYCAQRPPTTEMLRIIEFLKTVTTPGLRARLEQQLPFHALTSPTVATAQPSKPSAHVHARRA